MSLASDSMERATGIEPAWSAWEAEILPLNHARNNESLYRYLLYRPGHFRESSRVSRKAAASCTPSFPRTPLGTWTGWRAPIPLRRGSAGSPLASRRQTACASSRTSQARTSRWNKREVAPRARSWSTSCMMGGALRRRRCLPSTRRASRLAWEKRFSLSGLLRFSAAFRQRCCEEGMP